MKHRKIGATTIQRVVEFISPDFEPLAFFPETTPEDWAPHLDWLKPHAMDPDSGNLRFVMQSYILRTSHHTILIDSCIGNDKERPNNPNWHMRTDTQYLDGLAAIGLRPEDIDYVMCTHMHFDHVGWNTRLIDGRWVPTFPNARYLFSQKEYDHWYAHRDSAPTPYFTDSIEPIVEARLAQMVTSDYALDDEVWLEPTPGHTPDHYAVRLSSDGENAVFCGDAMHSPVQCRHPEWVARPDSEPALASKTRRALMERHCDTDTLVCTAHFPLPSAGHIVPFGDAFDFRPDSHDW
ncbi:MAG: MBL fold metallo-hydrolase [Alphaproteobacteria bacterium]|nr:MBL fold metallo-hydrolase [Alphaproteobacteria bacterium]